MIKPYLSIIVPVYNVEEYIQKCINSILSQNYLDFELILIDDGSTDNSGKICDEFAFESKKIKVIHQENGGLSNARNTGIKNANGDYIWFVDSDDWIVENAFSIIDQELRENNLEMLGFYETRFIEEQNKFQGPNNLKNIPLTNGSLYLKKNERFVPAACFYIYSSDFINRNQFFFKEKLIHEDDYFNLICFSKVQRIKKIDKVLYNYRIRKNSIISSKVTMQRLISYLEIVKLCKSLKKSNLDIYFIDTSIRFYLSLLFMHLYRFQDNNNVVDVYKIIDQAKQIISKQTYYLKDKRGVFLEKIIYNLSANLYFRYIKFRIKN